MATDSKSSSILANPFFRIILGLIIGAVVSVAIAFIVSLVADLIGGTTTGLISKQNKKISFVLGGVAGLLSIPILYVVNPLAASLIFGFPMIIVFILGGIGGVIGSHFGNKKQP